MSRHDLVSAPNYAEDMVVVNPQFAKLLPAMSLGDWSGTGGGGLVHPKGENSMAVSGLGCENPRLSHFSHFECKKTVVLPCRASTQCLCESRETTTVQQSPPG